MFVGLADKQAVQPSKLVDAKDLASEIGLPPSPQFVQAFVAEIKDRNLGPVSISPSNPGVLLNGAGIAEAESIRLSLKPKSFTDHLADEKFQKIGNLGISALSFFVSLGALVVAILALSKVN